ncbi:MAG: LysR family transcriptional regulator [Acidobacteria bacterium]|nr:LysR family transcriptional regulator [Acidobacteriota bacterium]
MEFMQLEMFVAAVEEGSVQRAARRVRRTPPAVSIALRKLEGEIGVSLFDRSDRSKRVLTDAGRTMYTHATRLLGERHTTLAALSEMKQRSEVES